MLSHTIKKLRLSNGLSQVELAKKLSVTKQAVSNWENNNILPSIDMLIKLADYFSVSTDFLLGREQKKTICVDNLTEKQIVHIKQIVDDLCSLKKL